MDAANWRNQMSAELRQTIVNKTLETLKRHLPFSGPEGLQELSKIAVKFEENMYDRATSQNDYLRKISLKMLTVEAQDQPNFLYSNCVRYEDTKLVACLLQILDSFKTEDGLRPGVEAVLESMLSASLVPSCHLNKYDIKNKMRTMKMNYEIIHDMLYNVPGFKWDAEKCMVDADKKVWDDYIKQHQAPGLVEKFKLAPFPLFEHLNVIFGQVPKLQEEPNAGVVPNPNTAVVP